MPDETAIPPDPEAKVYSLAAALEPGARDAFIEAAIAAVAKLGPAYGPGLAHRTLRRDLVAILTIRRPTPNARARAWRSTPPNAPTNTTSGGGAIASGVTSRTASRFSESGGASLTGRGARVKRPGAGRFKFSEGR